MKYIDLAKEQKGLLRRAFGVSHVTVWAALNFQTHSELAKRIRARALELGGTVRNALTTPAEFLPNCRADLVRDESGRVVRLVQTFADGIRIEIDDHCAVVWRGEERLEEFFPLGIGDWGEVVLRAREFTDRH